MGTLNQISKAMENAGVKHKVVLAAPYRDALIVKHTDKLHDIINNAVCHEFQPLRVSSVDIKVDSEGFTIRIDVEGKYSFLLLIDGIFGKKNTIIAVGTRPDGTIFDNKYVDNVGFHGTQALLMNAKSFMKETIDKVKKLYLDTTNHIGPTYNNSVKHNHVLASKAGTINKNASSKFLDVVDTVCRDEFEPLRVPSTEASVTGTGFSFRADVEGKYDFMLHVSGEFGKPITVIVYGTKPNGKIDGKYADHTNFQNVDTLMRGARSFVKEVITKVKNLYIAGNDAVASDKFNVPKFSSWKYDDSLSDSRYFTWTWKPVANHRVTVSLKTVGTGRLSLGEAKVSAFNIPAKGSWMLAEAEGGHYQFTKDPHKEAVFHNHEDAYKAFVNAYKNWNGGEATSAFGKKAAVGTPDGWEHALDKFVDGVQKIYDKYIHGNEFTLQYGSKIVSEDATKYTKVFIQEPHGNKRIYCFIDRSTGDVLKPATYTVPAKGARGNLFDADHGLKRMGPHGPAYNK